MRSASPDSLPVALTRPKLLEQWWSPQRTPAQTELLRLFQALPADQQEALAREGDPIPGARIRELAGK